MEKLYPKVNVVHKNLLSLFLLFVLFVPNLLRSQTYFSSFEAPQITNSVGYEYRPSGFSTWNFYGQSGLSKNWTVFTGSNPPAPSGSQVLFLQDNGSIHGPGYAETTLIFANDGYYRFRIKAAWREGCCSPIKDKIVIRVIVNDGLSDVEVGEFKLKSMNYDEYITLPLWLTAGDHKIRLEGESLQPGADYTGFVDEIAFEQLPELVNYPLMTVPKGATYAIGTANYDFDKLKVLGTLVAPQNKNVNIKAGYILVGGKGVFQIGQERSPYLRNATITLDGTNLTEIGGLTGPGTKFLAAMDTSIIRLHGKEKISWTKLRQNAIVGSTVIRVAESVDWEIGDEIVIAPSRAPSNTTDLSFANEYEKRTITAFANNNKNITLNAPLTYRHTGRIKTYSGNEQTWTADMRAEVGLLTHNIKIQGDDDSALTSSDEMYQKGAHVMVMGEAEAYVSGVELYRVGQSAIKARYPFHWHIRHDASGQYFKNSSVHQSYNRALTIHQTSNTLVENSVFFDHIGHGIFFEEGNEEDNQILGNLVIGTKRPTGDEILTKGETIDVIQNRAPASYWITHPNNTIEGNVAAGTIGTGFWYIFPHNDLGGQGKHPRVSEFGSFKNNVAHSTNNGFDIYDVLNVGDSVSKNYGYFPPNPNDLIMENCTWYANRVGVYTGVGSNDTKLNELALPTYAPDDWLVFKNNVFIDNEKAIMLASNNQVKNSVFVGNSGIGNAPTSGRSMVHIYDGAGRVSDSHIIGYNISGGSMFSYAGATYTYGNFRFTNTTRANSLKFDGTAATGINKRNATVYDEDGRLSGMLGTPGTLVVNIPFNSIGGVEESAPSGFLNMIRSTRRYVNTRPGVHLNVITNPIYGDGNYSWFPDVDVVRTGIGNAVTLSYQGRTPVLPFILNEVDLLYTYDWDYEAGEDITDVLPATNRIMRFTLAEAAQAGDFVIFRFKDMGEGLGKLTNVTVEMDSDDRIYAIEAGLPVTEVANLTALKNYFSLDLDGKYISAYWKTGDDLYIKAYTNGELFESFNIRWGVNQGGIANNTETLEGKRPEIETEGRVYPNPASTRLYIKGLAEGEAVQIVDTAGSLSENSTYKGYLDISKLRPGMYVVRTSKGNYKFQKE